MPSFRKARESLTKTKFRLFKRRSRLRSSSSDPAVSSPIVSKNESFGLNGERNECNSVLVSPSEVVAEAEANIGREQGVTAKAINESAGNITPLNLGFEENDQGLPTTAPAVWAEASGSADNATDIAVSIRGNEIVAVRSLADLADVNKNAKSIAPVVEMVEITGSGEHLISEYEKHHQYQYPPAIIPVSSAEDSDSVHGDVDITVELEDDEIISVGSSFEVEEDVSDAGERVDIDMSEVEATQCAEPNSVEYEKKDRYSPIGSCAEEADKECGGIEGMARKINAKDNASIVLVESSEERDDADSIAPLVDNPRDKDDSAADIIVSMGGEENESDVGDENEHDLSPVIGDTHEFVEPVDEHAYYPTETAQAEEADEESRTAKDENEYIDIASDSEDIVMSAAIEEHMTFDRTVGEQIGPNCNEQNASMNPAESDENGAAEERMLGGTDGIRFGAENEAAAEAETPYEQVKVSTPNTFHNGSLGGKKSTRVAHHFNVGDHVQVVKRGHKRNGMNGIVERQTRCFLFFKDIATEETIRMKPSSLVLVSGRIPSMENPSIKSSSVPTETRSEITSNSFGSSLPSQKPTDFAIHSSIKVVNDHSMHCGKEGTVQRHTPKFVWVIFNDNLPRKEVRISPKFLVRAECDNSKSTTITASMSTDLESNGEHGRTQREMDSTASKDDSKGAPSLGFGIYPLERIVLGNPNKKTSVESAFHQIWDENYLNLEMPLNDSELPLTETVGDKKFELYYAKIEEDKSCGLSFRGAKKKKVIAHYVHADNLRIHEEMLADFGTLPPSKIWARRSHFLSPATKLAFNKEYGVKSIIAHDMAMIEDLGTVGCGFISEQYLENLLGNNTEARRTNGIQVRIFVPTMGVFKGMLMRKRGIEGEPIQLNESLRKVLPSRSNEASDSGQIVVKRTFPSKDNLQVGRLFQNPENNIKLMTKSFRDGVKRGNSCKLSPMYQRVLRGLGVPKDTLKQYIRQYESNPEKLRHTHVVGMADPTNSLPPNAVFLTGIKFSPVELNELFVSRSPCMEAEDGRVVQVIRMKPGGMSDDDWEWFQSLAFGAIIFGNPRPGDKSLPEIIAEGDLDGDLYFVLWHEKILPLIQPVPVGTNNELCASNKDKIEKEKQFDPHWFEKTQGFISRIPRLHADIDQLVGMTYKASEAIEDIRDSDAVSFARAYKQALDAKKHGGLIFLPAHLWESVPEKLHKYLVQ